MSILLKVPSSIEARSNTENHVYTPTYPIWCNYQLQDAQISMRSHRLYLESIFVSKEEEFLVFCIDVYRSARVKHIPFI